MEKCIIVKMNLFFATIFVIVLIVGIILFIPSQINALSYARGVCLAPRGIACGDWICVNMKARNGICLIKGGDCISDSGIEYDESDCGVSIWPWIKE